MPKGVYTRKAKESKMREETVWPEREGFKSFGDRLNFLSEENQGMITGRLVLLPRKERP